MGIAKAILDLGLDQVPKSFLKKNVNQLVKEGKTTTKDLGNYINATHIKKQGVNKFRIYTPEYSKSGKLIEFDDTKITLKEVIQARNKHLNELGYNKKEIELLIDPKSDAQFGAVRFIKKQRAVDKVANNFDINNPKTWKGLLNKHGSSVKEGGRGTFFVLPTNKKISKFVKKKLEEAYKKTSNVFDADYDPAMTRKGMLKLFSSDEVTIPHNAYTSGLENLGIGKHVRTKSITKDKMEEFKTLLFNKYYTVGQRNHIRELTKIKKIINKEAGLDYISEEALELEHVKAFIDVIRKEGIDDLGYFIKNATQEEINHVGRLAMKYSNLRFATKLQNRGPLSKGSLFEVGNKGEHSKKGVFLRSQEVNRLRETGEIDKADILEQAIKDDIEKFIGLRKVEAKAGLPLKFDFTKNHWLPDYARIKSSEFYNIPSAQTMSVSDQLFQLAKSKGIELPSDFIPIKSRQFNKLKKEGGRIGYADGPGPEGVQPVASPSQEFDKEVKTMMELTGLDLGNSVLEVMKDRKSRKGFKIGGIVGDPRDAPGTASKLDSLNKVGAAEALLAGMGAGLLDIPKGAFTLGAALMDIGADTNNAAKVEEWFDNLNDWDEKAEQHWLGTFSRIAVNLGVPGAYGWKAGEKLATKALLAKRNGNYFKLADPELAAKFNTALNGKGRLMATFGAAGGAGVTDAIFVGDPESMGTFGDMASWGPTQLEPNDEKMASREIVNRMKFGLDGSLMIGLIGGTGSAIKTLYRRRNELSSNNDKIDKFFAAFRPRGRKSQEYFDMERRNIGARATDINWAGEQARKLDKHIDAIFPFVKNPFNKLGNKGRADFMRDLNDTLLSGSPTMNSIGKVDFGPMDRDKLNKIIKLMKDKGAKQSDVDGVLDSFEQMRGGWGHIFSRLGYSMDDEVRKGFSPLFGDKFRDYLGSTYELLQNKSLIPLFNYAPTEEVVEKTIKLFQESAKEAGKPITREQAEMYANQIVETAKLPPNLATSKEKTTGVFFNAPDFFANRTVLTEIDAAAPTIALRNLKKEPREIIEQLLGKVEDPMQTMLTGTNRLSLIGRRNQFYNDLLKSDEALISERVAFSKANPGVKTPDTMKGFFRETDTEAINAFGQNIKQIEIDASRTIEAGITNPLNGKWAEKGVAEAIEESAMVARDKSTLNQLYHSFLLYPKATSQMAKTILSPVTHVRNFISAGAFASSNGLFLQNPAEIAKAMKDAYKALQIPGSRMANDEYRKLLRLGVVNSNVRLGDLTKLLKDTNFGESINSRRALRGLMRPLSKIKKWTEDMYTAEDDFWKITSYALERSQLDKAYKKYGITRTIDQIDEEAADLVRNQIPNYDMVNDFIRATRKLPLGNFVSFPAEIMRTTANILQRAIKEIKLTHTLDDGRIVHPLRGIGMKRALGLGTTVVAVPYGTVEAAKAIYDVTEDEMQALRRFVPDWSKNSTLVPIRGEDGELKYIDFSHANAYDTMIRPITAMITGVQRGMSEGDLGQEIMKSMWEGTAETLSPFVSESIWTSAISDIFLRQGRTREGNRLWTEQTPWGERMNKAVMHALKTQFPGSIEQLKRLDLAIEPVDIFMKGKYDKYGQAFELGDELAGLAGLRAVKVDPIRAMKFKIADFRMGINNARREFTSPLLRGGPVTPEQIVDRYKVASDALYKVQEKMFRDYYAARTLGTSIRDLDIEFADRVSNTQLNSIKRGEFKPFIPSENIELAFRNNARAVGQADPYRAARNLIRDLIKLYDGMPLGLRLPNLDNPFKTSGLNLPIANSPILQQGLTNSPVTPPLVNVMPQNQQLQQTAAAGQKVFGPNDTVFGAA